jgi:quercetin dioxygenase-like cupin family protein
LQIRKIMNNEILQIAERLKGLREAVGASVEEIASVGGVLPEKYTAFENAEEDIPIGFLKQIAAEYKVDLSALLFADEPRMTSYFLTRKDKGLSIERVSDYKYQSLAAGFLNRKADVFQVTVEPKPDTTPIHHSSHAGQEFALVLGGKLLLQLRDKDIVLEEGDSIYFDASIPHGMKALEEKPVKFLTVVI